MNTPEHRRMVEAEKARKQAEVRFGVFVSVRKPVTRTFDDPEAAVVFAQRSARSAREVRTVYTVNGYGYPRDEIATVEPSGQVDLTWRGSELVSCNPKNRRKS